MTWKSAKNSALGYPAINLTTLDDTAKVPVGTVCRMVDETQGEGEFVYLPGVASTVVGDLVSYDMTPGAVTTTRALHDAINNSGKPVAVAMAACVAAKYGWYQRRGVAIVNAVGGTVAGKVMLTATAGSIGNTADAGDQVLSAQVLTAVGTPGAGTSYVHIEYPSVQGQIT